MEAVQRNQDAASRYTGASASGVNQAGGAAAYRRNASLDAAPPEPADNETTVTLSARAQQLTTQPQEGSTPGTGGPGAADNAQATTEQMSLLNAQLRRTYAGAGGPG